MSDLYSVMYNLDVLTCLANLSSNEVFTPPEVANKILDMLHIIPSRWFSGGKGLDDFRTEMLSDKRIRKLVDYDNFKDVFPGVDLAGGACFFLWDRDNPGLCEVTNAGANGINIATRNLNKYETFIRSNQAVAIVDKINTLHYKKHLHEVVYSMRPLQNLGCAAPGLSMRNG